MQFSWGNVISVSRWEDGGAKKVAKVTQSAMGRAGV